MAEIISSNRIVRSKHGEWIKKKNCNGKNVLCWSTFEWIIIDKNGNQHKRYDRNSQPHRTIIADKKNKRKFKFFGR